MPLEVIQQDNYLCKYILVKTIYPQRLSHKEIKFMWLPCLSFTGNKHFVPNPHIELLWNLLLEIWQNNL